MNHKVKTEDFENVADLSDLMGFEAYAADYFTIVMLQDTGTRRKNYEIHR